MPVSEAPTLTRQATCLRHSNVLLYGTIMKEKPGFSDDRTRQIIDQTRHGTGSNAGIQVEHAGERCSGFYDAFGRLGYNIDSLLASAGLRDDDLNDPDARISCEALGAVLSHAQQARFTPNLAFELAKVTPMALILCSIIWWSRRTTVGEGIRQFARYCPARGQPSRRSTCTRTSTQFVSRWPARQRRSVSSSAPR